MAERAWIQEKICFLERREITSKLIAGLEGRWDGLREGRTMPRRDEVDPVELVPRLPYTSFMELHCDPFRVRCRVVGTEVARVVGEDFSNRWLDETGWCEPSIALNQLLYERVAGNRGLSTPRRRARFAGGSAFPSPATASCHQHRAVSAIEPSGW